MTDYSNTPLNSGRRFGRQAATMATPNLNIGQEKTREITAISPKPSTPRITRTTFVSIFSVSQLCFSLSSDTHGLPQESSQIIQDELSQQ